MKPNHKYGIIIFIISLVYFLTEYFLINNTNLLSADGLWKSDKILSWLNGEEQGYMSSKNFLYYPLLAFLCNIIPDSFYIFQKITLINCFFAAWCNVYIFYLVYLLTRQKDISILSVIIHSGIGYVLGETVTSQDIIPAYTFFIGSFYYLFKTINQPNNQNVFLLIFCFILCWLLHWTMMPSLSMSIIVVTYFKKIDPNIKRKYFALGLTSCVILLIIIHFTTYLF